MEALKHAARVTGVEFDWPDFMECWRLYSPKNEPVVLDALLDCWLEVKHGALFLGGKNWRGRLINLGRILRANAGPDRGYIFSDSGGGKTLYQRLE